ncbi:MULTISPECIES: DUF885 family protein [Chitinophagaceae]
MKNRLSCLVLVIGSTGFIKAQVSKELYVPCQEIPNIMQNYSADYRSLYSFYSPHKGNFWRARNVDNADGGSEEKLLRLKKCNDDYLMQLSKVDFDHLPQECKVDYILFKRDMEEGNRKINACLDNYKSLVKIFSYENAIYDIGKIRRRGGNFDFQRTAFTFDSIAKQIGKIDSSLGNNQFSLIQLKLAEAKIEDLSNTVDWIQQFYNGYSPTYSWWMKKPNETLKTALFSLKAKVVFNEKKYQFNDGSNIIGVPIGLDGLMTQLKYEMIPYTPDELVALANKEFAWCDKEMLKASEDMGFGKNWKAAVEKVKQTYVPAGEQPALINRLYNESINFVKHHDMITIPALAEETWAMDMMSPEMQKIAPFFLGGNEITISYPTDDMSESDKLMSMRGNNPHFSRSTVFHELIPGHNLEFFMNERNRTYRNYDTPFWIEGWSLYWEMLMWDAGFPQGPEDRIGMLFWRMTRCARIIFSLNYHLGKWSPQQCIDFLVDRVAYERANAEGEVRRSFQGMYSPLYQVGYLVGGQQLLALKNELVNSKKMTLKEYNDNVIKLNCMPIEMLRAILTGQKLDKNFQTNWRFYGSLKN